jgi:hypothetical protein
VFLRDRGLVRDETRDRLPGASDHDFLALLSTLNQPRELRLLRTR